MSTRRLLVAAGAIAAAAISAAIVVASHGNHAGARPYTLPPCTTGYTLTPSQVAGANSPYPGSGLQTIASSAPPGTVICLSAGDDRAAVSGPVDLYSFSDASRPLVIRPAPGATVQASCWNLNNVKGLKIEGFTDPSEVGGVTTQGTTANISVNHNVIGWCVSNVVTPPKNSHIVFSYNTIDNYSTNGIVSPTASPDLQISNSSRVCPQGVIATHNTVIGYARKDELGPNGAKGNPDGFDLTAHDCGVRLTYNYIKGLTQGIDANGANHTDTFQDEGGGGPNNLIKGNWMTDVGNCFLADDNDLGLTYTDNVCSLEAGASFYAQCGGCIADRFDHNTFITTAAAPTPVTYGNSGSTAWSRPSSNLEWTNNLQLSSSGGPGAPTTNNPGQACSPRACSVDHNFESTSRGVGDITSGNVSFTGGAHPSSFAGYALSCPTSPGCSAASDGKNMGATNFSVTPGSGIPGP